MARGVNCSYRLQTQLLYFLAVLLSSISAEGQIRYKAQRFSISHGMSYERTTSALKDEDGFLWFGTFRGLNRFDGHSFLAYRSYAGDRSKLRNDRIVTMADDQTGKIWLKTYDNLVYRFDKRNEVFTPLSELLNDSSFKETTFSKIYSFEKGTAWLISNSQGVLHFSQRNKEKATYSYFRVGAKNPKHRLPTSIINFLKKDIAGNVWIGTSAGLVKLTSNKNGGFEVSTSNSVKEKFDFFTFAELGHFLYFTSKSGDLIIYNKESGDYEVKHLGPGVTSVAPSASEHKLYYTHGTPVITVVEHKSGFLKIETVKAPTSVTSAFSDRNGYLWLEPKGRGVIRFNPYDKAFRTFDNTKINYHVNDPYFSIFEDSNDRVWIDMKMSGFGYYDPIKDKVEFLEVASSAQSHRHENIVSLLYHDPAGVMWVNTDKRRLYKIILPSSDFQHQLLAPGSLRMLDNEVRGVLVDRRNRLWAATRNEKVFLFDRGRQNSDIFIQNTVQLGNIYAIYQDKSGCVWMGSKTNGLFRAEPVNKDESKYRLVRYGFNPDVPSSLSSNVIYSVIEDQERRIWVGTFEKGLNLLIHKNGQLVRVINNFKHYPKTSFQKIRHLAFDKNGKLWIGTTDGVLIGEVSGSNPQEYNFRRITKVPGDGRSLGNNEVQFIFRDHKDRMWVATAGGGLSLVTSSQPATFRNFTSKDGLPSDFVLSCTEDSDGNLWVSTSNGISKFDPESFEFQNYYTEDEVWETNYSPASVAKYYDGRLIFGTTEGYLTVFPDKIIRNRTRAKLVFTNLYVNNTEIRSGAKDNNILKSNISYAKGIVLNYNQNIISITYSILDQRSDNRQEYAYRLLGLDSNWYNNKSEKRITYTKLPPGKYVLQIKSLNSDLYSTLPVRTLDITILPPPWLTWWAYLIYFAFFGGMIFVVRRFALEMLKLRQGIAIEQRMATLKQNFFTNVSHELRTPLTLISSPIEQIALHENLSEEGRKNVEVVKKNADRMVRFVNHLLDIRKIQSGMARLNPSNVELVSFVKEISAHFYKAALDKQIKFTINHVQEEIQLSLDPEKIEIAIFNLLSNAFKFSPVGTEVELRIERVSEAKIINISVSDQGSGVDEPNLKRIFDLYYEGAHEQLTNYRGTGIGLALSKELVEMHQGVIFAQNKSSGGLTVSITLPINPPKFEEVGADTDNENLETESILSDDTELSEVKDKKVPLVLLVEDNVDLQGFIKQELRKFYRVEVAGDGEEGLAKAFRLLPDVIISDIMMPRMDGITMLDKLKNTTVTSHIPVVLLSARFSIESQIQGLNYGADFYIAKPFRVDFLLASLSALVSNRKKLFESLVEGKKIVELNPSRTQITSTDELFLRKVVEIVERQMKDQDFVIDTVADMLNMSRSPFYKKFKSLTNQTPVEFVREMRLKRGLQYLDAGETNITKIAYEVGFQDAKYFSTCFRQYFHKTPTEYLRSKAAVD